MPNQAPVILLTRPTRQSEGFRALLPQAGNVLISPVQRIVPLDFTIDFDRYTALIFASGNGVRAAARRADLAGHRAITVGDRTAQVARDFGMTAASAGGDAKNLIDLVVRDFSGEKLLFIRGKHSRGDVAEHLISNGLDTDVVIAYDQEPQILSRQAQAILAGDRRVILPLFSPRSAAILSDQITRSGAGAPLYLIAMSADILASWGGPEPVQTAVSKLKTAKSLAEEIVTRIAGWS